MMTFYDVAIVIYISFTLSPFHCSYRCQKYCLSERAECKHALVWFPSEKLTIDGAPGSAIRSGSSSGNIVFTVSRCPLPSRLPYPLGLSVNEVLTISSKSTNKEGKYKQTITVATAVAVVVFHYISTLSPINKETAFYMTHAENNPSSHWNCF